MTDDEIVVAFIDCQAWEERIERFVEGRLIKNHSGRRTTIDVDLAVSIIEGDRLANEPESYRS